MEGGPPRFPSDSTCPMVLGYPSDSTHNRFSLQDYHLLWWAAPGPSTICVHETSFQHEAPERPHNPLTATRVGYHTIKVWALTRSLAATRVISFDFSYLRVLRCFTSPRFASRPYGLGTGSRQMNSGGVPHSDISGSTPACGSPKLIAACHVLHRRSKPRHPPCSSW